VPSDWRSPSAAPRVGVSACLLGSAVRHDGGHKRDRFLTDVLGAHVEWVPVCPEVELGLGIPRPSIRLERAEGELRLVEPKRGNDITDAMRAFAAQRVTALGPLELCGYVLKKDSPSCGMERVRVHGGRGAPKRDGRGLFAAALMTRIESLPVEEEGRLSDAALRENFVTRVFALQRLRALFRGRLSLGELVAFHTAHKLLLLAHSEPAYRRLGRLVAGAKRLEAAELRARYEHGFMAALAELATRQRHTNVLQHMAGYLRERLDTASRAELGAEIEAYRTGLVARAVPSTLLRHHVRRLRIEYLAGQLYLEPLPRGLALD
jgi:uncharacterized protein YbgA (DUF1722 family)/uncharacterized protein YbbK (DUF523 family)